MSIYVDIHVLQTVPPSCVNRDDTGSPKSFITGLEARYERRLQKNVCYRRTWRSLP